ncbi:MAG: RipA family octameric membrane protein [Telluria sp.]
MTTPAPAPTPAPPSTVLPSQLDGTDSPIGNLAKAFNFATHQREFEITQLTQRNNFFMIFQGVLVAGIIQSHGLAAPVITFSVCAVGLVVSLLQVGMAAGSKFWQIRWERAAKTTEIWLLQELRDYERVSNFLTADAKFLTADEIVELNQINTTAARIRDPLTFDANAIRKLNGDDVRKKGFHPLRGLENYLILRKFSVSRIPIWTAIALSLFWLGLLSCTVSINGKTLWPLDGIADVEFVPLKAEKAKTD